MAEFTPTVCIVIPVYNGEDTIAECLESLLRLDYPRDRREIIVVENGSTDRTTEIVRQYPVRLYHNTVRGPAAARNFGVARSKAEIIATTDADCVANPDWLRNLVKPYVDPQVGGVGGEVLAYRREERSIVEQFSDDYPPLVNFISGEYEFLPHFVTANASYRRELFEQVGGFNPDLLTGEDIDLSWRVQIETGCKLVYAPEAIVYHKHRTTEAGLARLYRHYGFGEILLDTMYGKRSGYPRNLVFQLRRILGQSAALWRYIGSMVVRRIRLWRGQITPYEAAVPRLWFLIERSNIMGKLRAIMATRLMTDARPVLEMDRAALIEFLFGTKRG